MSSFLTQYRLRVRNATNSADAITVTSAGANAYITQAPQIDGSTFDPLTGEAKVGQATIHVADPELSAGVRFFTQHLGDSNGEPQLISRVAIIEISRASTPTFTPYFTGYITAIRLVDGITYEVTITHTTRDEETTKVWGTIDYPYFAATSRLLGGPVSNYVPSSHVNARVQEPQGQWNATVIAVHSTYVHFDISEDTSSAFPPRDLLRALRDKGGIRLSNNDFQRNVFAWASANAAKFFQRGFPTPAAQTEWSAISPRSGTSGVTGYMPRLRVQFLAKNGAAINHRAPMMASYSTTRMVAGVSLGIVESHCWEDLGNHFYVNWANTDPVAQPAVGDVLNFYVAAIDVSEVSPAWVVGHPVQILTDVLTYAGYTVNTGSLSAATAAVGAIQVALRITRAYTVSEAVKMLCGAFGLIVRTDLNGTRTIQCWRTRKTGVTVVSLADLADKSGLWWGIDEASRLNTIEWKTQRFQTWPGDAESDANEDDRYKTDRALDGVVQVEDTTSFLRLTTSPPQSRTQSYEIPGCLLASSGAPLVSLADALAAWSQQTFEVYGPGAAITELPVLHHITDDIGDEIELDLEPRPGLYDGQSPVAQRNTPEQCLIIGRTPQPWGATLTVVRVAAVGPAPTGGGASGPVFPTLNTAFTPALGTPPYENIDLTLVSTTGWSGVANAQIEYAQQATSPTGVESGTPWPTLWTNLATPFTIGAFSGSRVVWLRLRALLIGTNVAGPWSAWQSITLDPGITSGNGIVQTPSIDWTLNTSTGVVDVTLRNGPEAVKAYCTASLTGFPSSAAVLATTPDTVAPFAFPALITITPADVAFIAAVVLDVDGNRSILAYAVASFQTSSNVPGVMGLPGLQGVSGASGATGPTGATGTSGAVGVMGLPGPSGGPGATGPTGPTGATGVEGVMGLPGAQGNDGATGPTGPTGATGVDGAYGVMGLPGPSGIGTTGATGVQGATGVNGATGATGAAGTAGSAGSVGATGPTGPTGVTGPGFTWRGAWSAGSAYALRDVVFSSGSAYNCILAHSGIGTAPGSDPTRWSLLAQQGATGVNGVTGATGPTGPTGPTGVGVTGATGSTGVVGVTISTAAPSGSPSSVGSLWARY